MLICVKCDKPLDYYSIEHDSAVCVHCNTYLDYNCYGEKVVNKEELPPKLIDIADGEVLEYYKRELTDDKTGEEGTRLGLIRLTS